MGFYAYTGSYKLMEKSDEAMTAFSQLGDTHQIGKEHLAAIEAFTCTMYGKPKLTSINAVRMALFNDHHSPKNKNKPLEKIKGIDASLLAPCQMTLVEKIKQANYVTSVWKRANTAHSQLFVPEDKGWNLEDGTYSINWFSGKMIPDNIMQQLDEQMFKMRWKKVLINAYNSESDDEDILDETDESDNENVLE